ncbi:MULTISPECIES: glutamate 5-kinase [unclassified Sphingobium]|uniref:glutamate 5-kinase n=1 Tax=unclassified Sphingobium TaxID=2611147 RepID=UPI002224C5B6|nr:MULTISPECIES: glutamate 5-kinase [unclassified Sphingobium]MCW2410277.1 glutamate 5-kinase [Sphingobium sp. B8D3D]MCW2414031.1 glutamate 5-kinase [Sphingobium sp. B8D3A]
MIDALTGFPPAAVRRIVIKVGSALLVAPDGSVRRDWLTSLVDEIAARRADGQEIIVVSSGAIALGARRLGLAKGGRATLEDAQAAAAVGQIALSQVWADLLAGHDIPAAQMLVTLGDLEDRRRYLNASATLDRLAGLGVVPVVNENDSVATEEIRFGDNDRLAARIGQAAGADAVVLLSDIDGLYTANPHSNPDATLIPLVEKIDAAVLAMGDGNSASGMGSGGMISKLQAAQIATGAGAHLAIISGRVDAPLGHWQSSGRGTLFRASAKRGGRKGWLAGRLTVKGKLSVDAGAREALRKGRSLLPAGVTGTSGVYARGDVIDIVGPDGAVIARGLAQYDSQDAERIIGKRSAEVAGLLGGTPRAAMVHRSYMVLL